MYRGSDKSSLHYWFEFVTDKDLERLFYIIYPMIEDRIRELFPTLIKEYLPEIQEKVNVKVETSLNGKANDFFNLREDMEQYILDQLKKK